MEHIHSRIHCLLCKWISPPWSRAKGQKEFCSVSSSFIWMHYAILTIAIFKKRKQHFFKRKIQANPPGDRRFSLVIGTRCMFFPAQPSFIYRGVVLRLRKENTRRDLCLRHTLCLSINLQTWLFIFLNVVFEALFIYLFIYVFIFSYFRLKDIWDTHTHTHTDSGR